MVKYTRKDEWNTPGWVHKPLGPFDLDPCSGGNNIATVNYNIDEWENGLVLPWAGFVWCNPPFSQKDRWFERMREHDNGILLLTDRTSAPWFGEFAGYCGHFFLMGKRINFEGSRNTNPMGSVLFPFGELALERLRSSGLPGLLNKVERYNPRVKK